MKKRKKVFLHHYRKLNHKVRTTKKYITLRDSVKKRDNHTCQECGRSYIPLEVHHKIPFITIMVNNKVGNIREAFNCAELWKEENLVTLCIDCHKKTDSYMKRYKHG